MKSQVGEEESWLPKMCILLPEKKAKAQVTAFAGEPAASMAKEGARCTCWRYLLEQALVEQGLSECLGPADVHRVLPG